jgi:N-acetylmuramoyl-L-alanine amidase
MGIKVGIDIGHNCPPDTGAEGIKKEDILVKEVGNLAIASLKAKGIKVVECKPAGRVNTVRDSLQSRVAIANKEEVQLYCSLHFNAFNGKANGTEVFAISTTGANVAANVLKELVSLGFVNRGVKDGSHLYVVKKTKMPAILVEFLFCDSPRDMKLYNAQKLADAFVEGITKSLSSNLLDTFAIMPPTVDKSFPILQVNHASGELVEQLQRYFDLPIDGFFDSKLEVCIKTKQLILGLPITGYVDRSLWELIFPN